MNQVNPGDQYPIFRLLKDPNDSDTHYVRTVVKNAATNVILKTINLTDQGGRVFTGTWDVPYFPDRVYATIITTVYDDSGYTVLNPNYEEESDDVLIEQRWSQALGGGGGGGGVSYKKIAELFAAELDKFSKKLPAPEKFEQQPVDFSPLLRDILAAMELLPGKMPEAPPVDLKPIQRAISAVHDTINSRPVFQPSDINDAQMKELIGRATDYIVEEIYKAHQQAVDVAMPDIHQSVADALASKIHEHLKTTGIPLTLGSSMPSAPKEAQPAAAVVAPDARIRRLLGTDQTTK